MRSILKHQYGVDLDRVTWLTIDDAHLAEHEDPPNCQRIPSGKKLAQMMLGGGRSVEHNRSKSEQGK